MWNNIILNQMIIDEAGTHKTFQLLFNYIKFGNIWKQLVSFFALLFVAYPINKIAIPYIISAYIVTWKAGKQSLFNSCTWLTLAFATVTFIWSILYYLSLFMQQRIGVDVRQEMINDIFKCYEQSNKDVPLGKWLTHLEFVPYVVETLFYKLFCYLVPEFIGLAVVTGYFFYVDTTLGVGTVVFLLSCVAYFASNIYGSQALSKEEYDTQTTYNQKVHNMIDNLAYIQTSQANDFELDKFDGDCKNLYAKRANFCVRNTFFLFGFDVITVCFFGFVCFWMYHLMTQKRVTTQAIVLYTSVFVILISETQDIDLVIKMTTEVYNYVHKTSVFFDDNQLISQLRNSTATSPAAKRRPASLQQPPPSAEPSQSIAIQTHDLTYTHPDHTEPVFEHKSIRFATHQVHAIVGSAGCGKTTFAKLLAGIHAQPSKGQIRIYGTDTTRDVLLRRNTIMYLPQHIKLFDGSILDNIRYTHTSLTHEDVHQVLVTFDVSSILQQKHDTRNYLHRSVGVGGGQVSGGQKQVIVLMRTCIDTFLQHSDASRTDKSILILDEPTASLDDEMVVVVIKLLQRMKQTHTILMITHNQHIAKQCDTLTQFETIRAPTRQPRIATRTQSFYTGRPASE